MEGADLLYSGLMFAAGMLSLWTALLLTAAFIAPVSYTHLDVYKRQLTG